MVTGRTSTGSQLLLYLGVCMDNVIFGLVVLALSTVAVAQQPPGPPAAEPAPPRHLPDASEQVVAPTLTPVEGALPRLEGPLNWRVVDWPETYKECYLQRLDWRLGQLKERLALSPEQQSQAATWREQVSKRLDTVKVDFEAVVFATPSMLEAFLRPLLDPDQTTALADLKKEELTQLVDSLTSSQFSRLEKVVGLKTEQRGEVAKALADEMQAMAVFLLDDSRPLSPFSGNYDKDPQALGIEKLTTSLWGEGGTPLQKDDPRSQLFRAELSRRIEARVASLKPVLTSDQLENYRQYLRKNWVESWGLVLFPALE
jgi:hypothetical protein